MTWVKQSKLSRAPGPLSEERGVRLPQHLTASIHDFASVDRCSHSGGMGRMTKGWGCLGKNVRGLFGLQQHPVIV